MITKIVALTTVTTTMITKIVALTTVTTMIMALKAV